VLIGAVAKPDAGIIEICPFTTRRLRQEPTVDQRLCCAALPAGSETKEAPGSDNPRLPPFPPMPTAPRWAEKARAAGAASPPSDVAAVVLLRQKEVCNLQ